MKSNGLGFLGWCAGIAILLAVGFGGEAAARTAGAKYLVCKKNKDCVFVPSICGRCAPCKPTLRPVGNRKKLQWVRMLQARVRCAKPRCRKCAKHKNWLGTRTVCVRGRCAVAPLRKKPKRLRAELLCKKDKDCVFRPSICRRCAPCKPTLRQVCNRKTARRIRHMAARARCFKRRCGKCSSRRNWRGSKAVCFQKQCAIAPKPPLKISKVIHQANCDVTEEGTVAAAATAVIVARAGSAARPAPIPVFKADHPFLFIIRDVKTGVILFLGRFSAPK